MFTACVLVLFHHVSGQPFIRGPVLKNSSKIPFVLVRGPGLKNSSKISCYLKLVNFNLVTYRAGLLRELREHGAGMSTIGRLDRDEPCPPPAHLGKYAVIDPKQHYFTALGIETSGLSSRKHVDKE